MKLAIDHYSKKDVQTFVVDVLITLLGAFINAVAVNCVTVRFGFLSGGLTGIAVMIQYMTGIPSSISVFLLNLPVFVVGFLKIGKGFMVKTLIGLVSFSLFLQMTMSWNFHLTDPIIGAICSGVLSGVGVGMVYARDSSIGGIDVISIYINRNYSFPVGMMNASINVFILGVGTLLYGLQIVLYTITHIFICGKAADAVMEGFNKRRTLIIVSEKWQEIAQRVMHELKRGTTVIHAEGGYTGQERKMLYCVLSMVELAKIKRIILEVDSAAFYTIMDTREVTGSGFAPKRV